MPKKKSKKGKPQVHSDLKGLDININEFGEIRSNTDVGKINEFLNKNVEDKKFRERDDIDEIRKGKFPSHEEREEEEGDWDDVEDELTDHEDDWEEE